MDLRQLKMFSVVADLGSFTAAAEQLHVAQSAISRKIKMLEDELGEPVFKRDGRRIAITHAGTVMRGYANRVFLELHNAKIEVSELSQLQRGSMSVGSGVTACTYLLPLMLERFRARYPKVEIHAVTGTAQALIAELRSGSLDLGLIMLPVHEATLEVVPIHVDEMVLVTSARHRSLARREVIAPREIADLPLLYFQRGTAIRRLLDQYFEGLGIQPRIVMECDSVSPIKPLVRIDVGVSIVPLMAVAAEAARGELHILRLEGEPPQCHIGLVFQRSTYQPPAVRAFIEQCVAAR